jgi:UDP-N-acetylglucosamine 2-epimerase (non-hydrolysing)
MLGDDPAALATVEIADWEHTPSAIPLWDGHAAERIAEILVATYALQPAVAVGQ